MTHRRRWPRSAVRNGIAGRDRVAAEAAAGDVGAVAVADEDGTMDAAGVVDTAAAGMVDGGKF